MVNDGVGTLMEYVGESPIPVATVHRDAGAGLIALAQAATELTLSRVAYTPYVYDLTRDYPGQVPDRPLVYQPSQRDLAKIDARYYAVHAGARSGYRYDMTLSPSLGFHEREWHPGTRIEWVTPARSGGSRTRRTSTGRCRGRWCRASTPTPRAAPPGWTGSPRRSGPASATRSGCTTPAGRTT